MILKQLDVSLPLLLYLDIEPMHEVVSDLMAWCNTKLLLQPVFTHTHPFGSTSETMI